MKDMHEEDGGRIWPLFKKGETIGHYRIIRLIGQGGMGSVFLAAQKDPVERMVAIKVLRTSADSPVSRARFHLESRALALMNHPYIASVFEAGTTEQGNPFIVMEYVKGESILNYCDQHRLSIAQRIQVFIKALEAIQHAHQKGILHRDIKPGNVIVHDHEGEIIPKIIDFGTAKALDTTQGNTQRQTAEGLVVGTPMYMSPEQVTGLDSEVDVRTDIYALGLLFYELLVGVPALKTDNVSQIHLFHTILNVDADAPSSRVADLEAESLHARDVDRPELERLLKGDLDWIILKAMEKDTERRYASISDFLQDVIRFLRKEPVIAGPPTTLYKVQKFMVRNRLLVSFGVLACILLFGGIVGTSFGMMKALQEKQNARISEQKALKTSAYLQGLIASVDPYRDGKKVQVVQLLEKASKDMDRELHDDPEILGEMRFTLGWTFLELGLYEKAGRELEQARKAQVEALGVNHPDTLKTMNALGRLAYKQGHFQESRQILASNWHKESEILGSKNDQTLWSQYTLAKVLANMGEYERAEQYLRQVIKNREETVGLDHPSYLVALNSLCMVLSSQGKNKESLQLQSDALEKLQVVLGATHPTTLNSASNLALILKNNGLYSRAVDLARQTYSQQVTLLGDKHPETLDTLYILAESELANQNDEAALRSFRACLDARKVSLGETHPDTLMTQLALGDVFRLRGNKQRALHAYEQVFNQWQKASYSSSLDKVSKGLTDYLDVLIELGHLDEAEYCLEEMLKKNLNGLNRKAFEQTYRARISRLEGAPSDR